MPRRHSRSPTTTPVAPVSTARATAHEPTAQRVAGVSAETVTVLFPSAWPRRRSPSRPAPPPSPGSPALVGVLERAHHTAVGLARQHRRGHPGLGLVLGVRLARRRPLHLLRRLRDVHRPVALDLLQGVVELVRRVLGVEDLLGVPQPCEGRCWNSPSESRSPNFTLRTFDSCIAVAIAMVAARGGIPRCTAMAVIAAALLAWSGAHENVEPDAVTRHCSPDTRRAQVPHPEHGGGADDRRARRRPAPPPGGAGAASEAAPRRG